MGTKIYSSDEIKFVEKPTSSKFKDLEGQIFFKLLVLGYAGKFGKGRQKHHYWWCQCSCPEKTIKIIGGSNLIRNSTKSCGCYKIEYNTTHGMFYTKEYKSFRDARERCNNPNNVAYHNYGGRGIKLLFDSFEEFYEYMGDIPEPKEDYTLDRINVNQHYEKGNMRWATNFQQSRNRRDNHWVTYKNETKCIQDWSKVYNIGQATISTRLLKLGWCEDCTFTIPVYKKGEPKPFCPHR